MWMSRIPRMGVMIGIESLSLSLKFRSEVKFFFRIRLADRVVI
jgi:hypothetical protein